MEVIKSRYGLDRSVEWLHNNKIRVLGESQFVRTSTNPKDNQISMFDFEGGPAYTVGGKLRFMNSNWKIKGISPIETNKKGLSGCLLEVTPIIP
jgi:hypothetical protein